MILAPPGTRWGIARGPAVPAARPAAGTAAAAAAAARGPAVAPPLQQWRRLLAAPCAAAAPDAAAAAPSPRAAWTYKYKRSRGPSPCAPGDTFCCELEALVQNVLGYPYVPPKIHNRIERLRPRGIDALTSLIERMADHFGSEIALTYLRRAPELLAFDFSELAAREAALASTLGVAPAELPPLLHKNPSLLALETEELRARFEALPRVLRFTPQQVEALIIKYPLVLSRRTSALQYMVAQLRHLAQSRAQWQADVDAITPSLLAFFLRDFGDQVRRLEYLASTGESPGIALREVMKPSNRLFKAHHRGFDTWTAAMRQRRARQQAALEQRAAARGEGLSGDVGEPVAARSGWGQPQQQPPQQQQQQQRGTESAPSELGAAPQEQRAVPRSRPVADSGSKQPPQRRERRQQRQQRQQQEQEQQDG